jgi:hypothetical protein
MSRNIGRVVDSGNEIWQQDRFAGDIVIGTILASGIALTVSLLIVWLITL